MKLVKFDNGTWSVRRHWFLGWYFQSLEDSRYWRRKSVCFYHCQGTEELARATLRKLKHEKSEYKYTIIE